MFLLLKSGCGLPVCILRLVSGNSDTMEEKIRTELRKIDSLLRSPDYSLEMAKALDAAYYKGVGEEPGEFLQPGEDTATVKKSAKEEKIAINLAGFYATECGIGYLSAKEQKKPTDILAAIRDRKIDTGSVLLLNRFANATWKAGQPFRDMKRITRTTFTVAEFLPPEEVKKDYEQIVAAASELLSSMKDVTDGDIKTQMEKLRSLLQSESFAVEIAGYQDSAGNSNQQMAGNNFLSTEDGMASITKSVKDEKIASNLAGFYALECGISYFVATKHVLPSELMRSIIDGTISPEDKELFSRLANATWKAGQPFRALNRIKRDTFTPFYFLTEKDIEKDWVQIRAAAEKLLESLQ